ncbi:matrixin family metalloprotease [Marine Group I thaumarchaeote]|uniref:Matrixin family metalloprotease n=1 Tax=Marine Group I thaumarchaeote TaxID=2511932 RepID=A0A7K4NTD8_9ARCH|nr:matrixin family metalloprotease [Marine Group I thaumarchaeote]
MKQNMSQNTIKLFTVILFTFTFFIGSAYAENIDERDKLFAEAFEPFLKGEYEKSIKIFDEILEIYPEDYKIFEMKGIALSNLRLESTLAMQPQQNTAPRDPSNLNKSSMLEFYKALEINPNSVLALNGMGLGFGNFGEYSEAEAYFKKSLEVNPDNKVTQNYLISLENLKKKYSLNVFENPTKKPDFLKMMEENTIPSWIKNNAGWWADDKINDGDFISGIEYLIENKIIKVSTYVNKENSTDIIPSWIKSNAGWWSSGKISDNDFLTGIEYLIENSIISVNAKINSELLEKDLERKAWNFERYLINIQSDIKKQNRYVENINPSEYVIIKYWKDYHKWNLEFYLDKPEVFPDRKVWIDPETGNYIIEYLIYINEQPVGLPIDHVSTLQNSFSVWETIEYDTSDGKKASVKFYTTSVKGEANVWVTWVVRNIGEGVLGHANLGKGVVEVAIGSYGCDGGFQLFDNNTVEYIMTHELGHSLGFGHSNDPDKIMYPSIPYTNYAYCLLN